MPSPPQGPVFVAKLVEAVIRGVDRNQIPRAQYGAVLIDEGHDFERDWLRLVVQMLDPESNSLLLLYDDAQSIYQHQRERFTFRSVGISAMGRTKILKRNYRNTDEILACASAFAGALLEEVQADDDTVPRVSPEPGGRKGPKPVFREPRSMQDEADSIAREIDKRRKAGTSLGEIGVFYTAPFVATEVMASLTRAGIPFEWLKDPNARQWQPGHESVKLMTLHSSKGLQYQVGIIAGAGCLPWRSPAEDARLMYVAMTRATHELLITGSRRSVFTERLREVCRVEAA